MSLKNSSNFLRLSPVTEMNVSEKPAYRFKSFVLNTAERQLLREGQAISMTPKVFDTLVYLVQNAGHLVEKDELMKAVWQSSFVEEGNLTRSIHTLRRVLGQDKNGNKFIETVPTKGYRFVADVEPVATGREFVRMPLIVGGNEPTVTPVLPDPPITTEGISAPLLIASETETPPVPVKVEMRTVLITALVLIMLVAVSGFWFSRGEWLPGPFRGALSRHSTNGEAYQNYRQGRLLIEGRKYKEALEHFEKAIELDPQYAAAYAGKADAKIILFHAGAQPLHDDIAQARSAVKKALDLDETNSYAHTVSCRLLTTYDWDHAAAETQCLRAVELDPNDFEARREVGFLLNSLGRQEEALTQMRTAVALAPTSFNKRSLGLVLYYSRRYDEAIEQFQQVEATDPQYREKVKWLVRSNEMKNDHPGALDSYVKGKEAAGSSPDEIASIRSTFATEGWPGVLRKIVGPAGGAEPAQGHFSAGNFAQHGENDRAFEVLDQMVKRHAIMLVQSAREPAFDPLRDDPRFDAMLRKIGLK